MRSKFNRRSFSALVEVLETRRLLSGTVLQTNLVSDLPGAAAIPDPNLVNPWGIAESPSSPTRPGSPFWISDNNAGVSTLYNVPGAGSTPVSVNGLVVKIPTPGDPQGSSGTPTGAVFNTDGGAAGGFKVSGFKADGITPTSASAIFLFDSEDGTILGWNPGVNPAGVAPAGVGKSATIAVDNSGNNFTEPDPNKQTGAVYKGLTIASSSTPIFTSDPSSTTVLYATNFRSATIEAYDPGFTAIPLPSGAFSDPNIPKGYSPFNIQELNGMLFVTYAKQDKTHHDDDAGPGRGFVDVFNLNGTPGLAGGSVRLASRGALDSPWGLAIAPSSFGSLAGDLLVGNFGDGSINVFNATTGAPQGQLTDPDGEPIQIDGLWTLRVGNDGNGGATNTIYFSAGIFGEKHGLFGSLTPVAPGSPEGPAEAQMATAALDVAQLNLTALQADIASNAPKSQIHQDAQAFRMSVEDLKKVDDNLLDDISDDGGASSADTSAAAAIDAFLDQLKGHDHDHDGQGQDM